MAYSQQTTHYGLPLPTSGDKSTFLDTNDAFGRIDSDIYEAKTNATAAVQDIGQIQLDVSQLKASTLEIQTDITQLQSRQTITEGNVTELLADMDTAQADISKLQTDFTGLIKKATKNNITTWGDLCSLVMSIVDKNILAFSLTISSPDSYALSYNLSWKRHPSDSIILTSNSAEMMFTDDAVNRYPYATGTPTDLTNNPITIAGLVWTAEIAYIEV